MYIHNINFMVKKNIYLDMLQTDKHFTVYLLLKNNPEQLSYQAHVQDIKIFTI